MSIRVVVVDDSALVRRVVTAALNALPDIAVAATADNGRDALDVIAAQAPDAVVLDVEMPVMDGIETMRALRRSHPGLPVIMFSTVTERGARATFDALAAGARDYVTKPTNSSGIAESVEMIQRELGARLRALCAAKPAAAAPLATTRAVPTATLPDPGRRVDILAVGASTGGPDALTTVLSALPATLPVPVVVVQHMPPTFTTLLADRLNRLCSITVREARAGEPLQPGTAYIAPGDYHLSVTGTAATAAAALTQGAPEHFCRPAVDVLLRSVATVYGPRALAVILTGMGSDGAAGAETISRAGGSVYAQDKATSVVWGMPGATVATGRASRILPLPDIAAAVTTRLALGRTEMAPR